MAAQESDASDGNPATTPSAGGGAARGAGPSRARLRAVPADGEAAPDPAEPALSVVLPIYQEEPVLDGTLTALVAFLEDLGRSFEIVGVDDGSRDRSLEILRRWAARDHRIRAEALPVNRGKGAAVRAGVLASRGRAVLFMDADLSTPLEEMHGFLGALDSGYDVVLGNRRAPGSNIERHQPWIRELLGKGFTFVTRHLLAPGVQDFTCGFKAFRREAAEQIFERSTLDGWAFDAELVVIASAKGYKLAQVPVRWRHDDDTKVRLLHAVFGSARELVVIFWRRLRGEYR
ncbi:dolichyl-phosphate beta-glucosyltransferase [Engelhardtia mirabilis]|uniref:dolichyl-phosphate beta-glucosyltransferase n=1 Tax=Engelhardtia mirabilis TaxID=2528011 RepID=A0A518BQ14_9BACT|nr:Undecaprenyl-phosphate 4-deoxy-4-formamido-L-arabinose transferase [Planctomycetes bacterium Pla133]QDV03384.1 Undecaprenyl-phosphate 4-deoxy-4-formamido-L-arabinose transferase [Planctomycetes bacterium Pla86]